MLLRPYMGAAACLVVVIAAVFALRGGDKGFSLYASDAAAPAQAKLEDGAFFSVLENSATGADEAPAEAAAPAAPAAPPNPDCSGVESDMNEPCGGKELSEREPGGEEFIPGTEVVRADYELLLNGSLVSGSSASPELSRILANSGEPVTEEPTGGDRAFLSLDCGGETFELLLRFDGDRLIVQTSGGFYAAAGSAEEFLLAINFAGE